MSMRKENAENKSPLGKPKLITLHWTAGNYDTTYNHYHFNVKGSGEVVQTLSVLYKGSHTWQRNANNIGVSMCCMFSNKYPPTKKQIEATAKLVADLVGIFDIEWDNIKDHAHYAKLDGYANLRWDVGALNYKILEKAKWYRDRVIKGIDKNNLVDKVR
jgi:N-acetyl-anhydromuramyl-L-alanine amidase AmpD